MITVTYVQLLAVVIVPIAFGLLYEGLMWVRRRKMYDPFVANEETARARGELINHINTYVRTPNHAYLIKLYTDGPSYEEHLKALRRGEDVAALYPQEFREFMYKAVYGEDVFHLNEWLRGNKPKVYAEYLRNRKTLRRITR